MNLHDLHVRLNATLADDGIPLHYGNLEDEYLAATQSVIVMDRSHESRLILTGADRAKFVNRMSTNQIDDLATGHGRGTLFTNANARILERAEVYARSDDFLLLGEPGHGRALGQYLARNIFFGDQCRVSDASSDTAQFALCGPNVRSIMRDLGLKNDLNMPGICEMEIADVQVSVIRRKPLSQDYWAIVCKQENAAAVFAAVLSAGSDHGIKAAGSLTYHRLRVQSGRPAERELSQEYLPLEVGLWDEVSFKKGCYTGQEIIARMESREKLARTIVSLEANGYLEVPAHLSNYQRQPVGELTSIAQIAVDRSIALGIIKVDYAVAGTILYVDDLEFRVTGLVGAQAPYLSRLMTS